MGIVIDFGEVRHVKLLVRSCKNENFSITSANYVLRKGDVIEDSGECSIYGHVIDTIISPKTIGCYKLQITYHILDETLIDTVEVNVV